LDPVSAKLIAICVTALLGLLASLFGTDTKTLNKIREFLENLADGVRKVAMDPWDSGSSDEPPDNGNDNGNGKGACYIAHGTYGNTADLTKFYVVRNSLPKCIVNGYYQIGPFLNKHKLSRITFLPFLEAIKGVMQ